MAPARCPGNGSGALGMRVACSFCPLDSSCNLVVKAQLVALFAAWSFRRSVVSMTSMNSTGISVTSVLQPRKVGFGFGNLLPGSCQRGPFGHQDFCLQVQQIRMRI